MSIEKITAKIISDAQEQADTAADQARKECSEILSAAKAEADEILKRAESEGNSQKERLISRRRYVAQIDGRKVILEEKQKLIANCFEQAIERITSMGGDAYTAFLVRLLADTGATAGELILSPSDLKNIGDKLVKTASKRIANSSFTLSQETRDIRGGFLLKNGSVYVNCTVEALVDENRAELVGDVAARLFE